MKERDFDFGKDGRHDRSFLQSATALKVLPLAKFMRIVHG